ncbi:hypothetical protein CTY75_01340 [Acinetobacter baumannii]|uniref:hypothetical protein n=1 Tax=Acinetobacter pittii TaxID=48296 RepID=UPI0023190E3E|nr:hypothetical protein [Acinetobacter baumannii]
MKRVEHLNPIISAILKTNIIFKGRACGRTTLNFFGLCSARLPMLQWDYSKDFCFNPKKIKKISDRKMRKACYQSFALYKKTFKPRSIKKLKIFKDEWPSLEKWLASMLEATKTAAKKFSDMTDAMSYAFRTVKNGYWCAWDPAKEV